jgi:ribosomal protein L40E
MRELCERVKNKVQQRIEIVIDEVGANNERHTGKRDKICRECFRNKPWPTKKCGNCGSSDFHDYLCTKEVRLLLFKEWLQLQGYWPFESAKYAKLPEFLGNHVFPPLTAGPRADSTTLAL